MTKDSRFVGVVHWLVSRALVVYIGMVMGIILHIWICVYTTAYIYVSTLGFLSLKLKRHCTNFWGIFPSKTVPFFYIFIYIYIYMCVGFGKRWNLILYNKICKIFRNTTCFSNSQAKSAWTDFGEDQQCSRSGNICRGRRILLNQCIRSFL